MPKYVVLTSFNEGTEEERKKGEVVELTKEQAGLFVQTKRLSPLPDDKDGGGDETDFAKEVNKHKLLKGDENLSDFTVKELTALPEWDLVPEPRPTLKADIIAALESVRKTE